MSETAVLPEPTTELKAPPSTSAAPPAPAAPATTPVPRAKERRFRASLRFNGFRYLTLALCTLGVWGLFQASMWLGTGKPEGTFLLVLAGGLLAAAAKTGIDILNWAEANRQAVHAERVRAVQRVFQRACAVREQATTDWRRMHTVLMDNLSGQSQEIRLFRDHDLTDRQGEKLLDKALSEEAWIRPEGVDAVRQFKKYVAVLDYDALATESEFLAAFNGLLERLRRDLALAAIGIPLD